MLTITGFSVEFVKDPFGILKGKRYEFLLDIDVPEEDELYTENGLYVRAIYSVEDEKQALVKHEIFEKSTELLLDFELEDDEAAIVESFCKEHYMEAE
ncbi:DUF6509 family protein [Paenibacillus hexagrammi]|uniref:DUF6509 family protein n=1 Tax=Paenibacillus hexagrammi TaxID=2908839 RepID=A0ABY3SDY2_9BACL|nr:DUF6509 family protein [Paenibacillus sp. YPD9-1]UJF31341.1 DUF6509 family protein [Paenibacillus sp. YPD9-1]